MWQENTAKVVQTLNNACVSLFRRATISVSEARTSRLGLVLRNNRQSQVWWCMLLRPAMGGLGQPALGRGRREGLAIDRCILSEDKRKPVSRTDP